jgi:hypothetical protein
MAAYATCGSQFRDRPAPSETIKVRFRYSQQLLIKAQIVDFSLNHNIF